MSIVSSLFGWGCIVTVILGQWLLRPLLGEIGAAGTMILVVEIIIGLVALMMLSATPSDLHNLFRRR